MFQDRMANTGERPSQIWEAKWPDAREQSLNRRQHVAESVVTWSELCRSMQNDGATAQATLLICASHGRVARRLGDEQNR